MHLLALAVIGVAAGGLLGLFGVGGSSFATAVGLFAGLLANGGGFLLVTFSIWFVTYRLCFT